MKNVVAFRRLLRNSHELLLASAVGPVLYLLLSALLPHSDRFVY